MSVIVKREDGQVINFIKGADIAIIPRISKSSDDAKNQDTIKQMDEFAS
jgi:magnesium-transporting ATPase (P-type)